MWVGLFGWCTMGGGGMSNFRQVDRQTGFLLPPSVDEWLPERHLARFVVEVIEGLAAKMGKGSPFADFRMILIGDCFVRDLRRRSSRVWRRATDRHATGRTYRVL